MQKLALISGGILSGISVILGAFGAHALRDTLEAAGRLETFETAVRYQFFHALAIIFTGMLMYRIDHRFLNWSVISFISGIIIFSGSLYILSLSGISKWGAVTPFGGLLMIIGWTFFVLGVIKG